MHIKVRMLSIAFTILALAVSGCGAPTPTATPVPSPTATSAPTTTPAPTPTATQAAPAALTWEMLKNAEYNSDFTGSKKAKLVDGKYEEAAAPGSASKTTVQILAQPLAFADLNGDGLDDAVVIIVASGGGSGSFYTLNVVLNEKSGPRHAAAILLGDRVQVKSLTVKGTDITASMIIHGPSDPLCCPTLAATNVYHFQNGQLVADAVTPTAVVAVKPPALTLEQLMNAVYLSEFTASQKAKLTNGRYEEAIAPGSVSKISIAFVPQQYALGDLNGDGADDAVVFLSANTGGSGSFVSINAVLNDKGSPRAVSYMAIGDRVQIKGVTIKSGEISVNVVRQGPNDPMCCPTQEATLKYRLQAEKLVAVN